MQFSLHRLVAISLIISVIVGGSIGGFVYWILSGELEALRAPASRTQAIQENGEYLAQTADEDRVISVVKEVSPAVVSIILTRDEPVFEQVFRDPFEDIFGGPSPFLVPELEERGTERREVGGGSGFIVSEDGMIITNKHVVLDDDVDYTVFTNDGESYPAQVLARDPLQDIAVIKIESSTPLPFVRLGNSNHLQNGQTVVAIGNALGEFRNTVSVGVISGLGRTITASDGQGFVETIENVIQTDAAINRGNSGGPLLNLAGEVIGVNTATVTGAQSIGFAIPSQRVKRDVYQVREIGKIVYPLVGIQYILLTDDIKEEENLAVAEGAWVQEVLPGSAGEDAGLLADDIVLEIDGTPITQENPLADVLQRFDETSSRPLYSPGDSIRLKVLRGDTELFFDVTLGDREE